VFLNAGRLITLFLLLGLAACTSVRPVMAPGWSERQASLAAVENWALHGRMAFRSGEEGGQARLEWQQFADTSQIQLAGPFGAGAYNLVWEPQFVSLADASGERSIEYTGAAAAENFLTEQLGWSFPAGSIRYWVMGLPDPANASDIQFDEAGQLATIRQYDWDVQYERFQNIDGYVLPTRITIQNDDARLRIVVSDWRLQEHSG